MTIADLKAYLGGYKDDDQVIALWWDKDSFFEYDFTDEHWKTIVNKTEDYSFGGIGEMMMMMMMGDIASDLEYEVK
tara:strand:+ start:281 stop:508 length:228 start_codon:yes stop_codon:yes gene_type:complete